ncbi:protein DETOXIFICATION 55 isoform X1 [Primulina eburnea]|uniref:protein DETOXIFICATION 55 isoform X1 n=2 Tax=Primulina eburnea TaxID=1245227 RepID=UPI003C6C9736
MTAGNTKKIPTMIEVREELKNIINIGFPIFAMGLLNYLRNLISVACMGKLGSLELAGGALAIGFTNITGYSVLSGLAMGMEPICSQAFGSKNLAMVSLTLQRTIIMLLFASIPIGMLWIKLESLMLWLNQDPQVVHIASLYCRIAVPDLMANSLLHPLRIYLRSKGTKWPLLWCTLPAILLHFPITIYLTFYHHLGVQGVAVSTFIANLNTLSFILGYMYYTHGEKIPLNKPFEPPSRQFGLTTSLGEGWGMMLRLAIPSCLGVCLEWWWYEFMTLLAGYINKPDIALATSAIVIQTTSLMYTLPSALSASVSTRVGNELGAGRPDKAHLATTVAITLALSTSAFSFLLTILGRRAWGRVFTNDTDVLELTTVVLPILGLCEFANCPQTTCCGVLRGSARSSISVCINFCSFYLIGMPIAIALAFFWNMGFLGLCYGLLAAQATCIFYILTVIYRMDWEYESLQAKYLVGQCNEFLPANLLQKCEEAGIIV